ncbi:reticulon-like protein B12 [Iris pallida]|uniref:Reticulon-like protein n=1 Tax=Iris pallida TaxID=29817 RepID=A0AAX6E049_IRIPA|nr:reticulon-like protein B12 [Iris pallida]
MESSSASSTMDSSSSSSSVHQLLGGGIVADVILWRKQNITVGILLATLAAWLVFEISGYMLMSLVSNVLLLSVSILFVWAKSAQLLNRPPPPIPKLHLSEERISEVAVLFHSWVNAVLSAFHNIALGKDPNLFYKVASCLLLISIVGSWMDFHTLGYASIVILLTVPVLFEKYKDNIDRYVMLAHIKLHLYERVYAECFCKAKCWILEILKEC